VSISVHVECYSSYTYAQEPRAVEWGEQLFKVVRVVKRWRTPTGPAFRVELARPQIASLTSQTLNLVELHYLEFEDRWTMSVQD
jgi:hypothetical protein